MIKHRLPPHWQEAFAAIHVDWIVITAAAVGLAIVAGASIQAGEMGLAANLVGYVTAYALF
jgi:hypothetical protein